MTAFVLFMVALVLSLGLFGQSPKADRMPSVTAAPLVTVPAPAGIEQDKLDSSSAALYADLPLDHRRYLLYLYARLYRPRTAETLAQRILVESPGDKQTMLVMASMYLELHQTEKAILWGQALVEHYPTDDQALYFMAAAQYQAGHFAIADQLFARIKSTKYKKRRYAYESDLASAAAKAGDWYHGMLSYQELLRHHQLNEELRMQTREVLDEIYRDHLPQLSIEESFISLKQGEMRRTDVDYRQHFRDSQRVFVRFTREETVVRPEEDVRAGRRSGNDGVIGLESALPSGFSSAVWVGGFEEGVMGGAYLNKNFGTQRDAKVQIDANLRALDGLVIESLDGRQNRISLQTQYLIDPRWFATFQANARQIAINNKSLGYGYGLDWTLENIIIHNRPELRVGYKGSVSWFTRTSDDMRLVEPIIGPGVSATAGRAALDNLVATYINRQGLFVSFTDKLFNGFLAYDATAGADYAFDEDAIEYYAQAGFRVYPIKSIELKAEGGYFSSARTIDRASDQWLLILGAKFWF